MSKHRRTSSDNRHGASRVGNISMSGSTSASPGSALTAGGGGGGGPTATVVVASPTPTTFVVELPHRGPNGEGGHYSGPVDTTNKLPHGTGGLLTQDGTRYVGTFAAGKMEGLGGWITANGDMFIAHFVNGIFQPGKECQVTGQWTPLDLAGGEVEVGGFTLKVLVDEHGQQYTGQVDATKKLPNGFGVGQFDGGKRTYLGEIVDGQFHGYGLEAFNDGAYHLGEYAHNKLHGQGTFTAPNGESYVGEWKDDKMHGQGTFTFANGNVYQGEWKEGTQHGQGTYTFANGDVYVYKGEYKGGKAHGAGVLFHRDGRRLVGHFQEGVPHGDCDEFDDGALLWSGKYFKGARLETQLPDLVPFKVDEDGVQKEDLQCLICLCVLDNPVQLYLVRDPMVPCGASDTSTGHNFCRPCAGKLPHDKGCPQCHGTLDHWEPTLDTDLSAEADAVHGSCDGQVWLNNDLVPCPWTGTLQEHRQQHRSLEIHYKVVSSPEAPVQ